MSDDDQFLLKDATPFYMYCIVYFLWRNYYGYTIKAKKFLLDKGIIQNERADKCGILQAAILALIDMPTFKMTMKGSLDDGCTGY